MLALYAQSCILANTTDMKRMQIRYTLGRKLDDEPYHIATVRSPLTRGLVSRFDDIRDEIVESFKDYIPLTKGEFVNRRKREWLHSAFVARLDDYQRVSDSDAHCMPYEQ